MKAWAQVFRLAVALISAFAAGCGGGGGGAPPPPPNETAGIWRGTVSIDGLSFGGSIGLIDSTGNTNIIVGYDDTQFSGDLVSSEGTLVRGGLNFYDPSGQPTGLYALAEGYVIPGSRLTATLNGVIDTTSSTVTLDLTYDTVYDRPAAMALISGTWSETIATTYTRTLTIDGAGTISGSDSDGCVYSGTVQIPDPNHNMYILNIDVDSCFNYTIPTRGQAVLTDTVASNDTLTAGLTGTVGLLPKESFVYRLTRQ